MKLHPLIAGAIVTAMLGLQYWMLSEISALRVNVATLSTELHMHMNQTSGKIAQR